MRFLLSAVGRAKAGPETVLFDHYRSRLLTPFTLKEVEEKRPLPKADRMARESALLLDAVPEGAVVIVLDERGATMDSPAFAALLGRWKDEGQRDIAFLIGGADGHGQPVRDRADRLLALGAMTWPHLLVRALVAEQLYRAECILANHPYHRV